LEHKGYEKMLRWVAVQMYSFLWNKKIPPPQNEKKGGGRDNQKASLNYER
jgi:hypothetical protein